MGVVEVLAALGPVTVGHVASVLFLWGPLVYSAVFRWRRWSR